MAASQKKRSARRAHVYKSFNLHTLLLHSLSLSTIIHELHHQLQDHSSKVNTMTSNVAANAGGKGTAVM